MKEATWATSTDLRAMLRDLSRRDQYGPTRVRASDRLYRLFACACCRQVWHLLADKRLRAVVKVAEQVADGEATSEELGRAHRAAQQGGLELARQAASAPTRSAAEAALVVGSVFPSTAARRAAELVQATNCPTATAAFQADLLRDIFGTPHRPVRLADTLLCPWLTPQVVGLAQAAYDQRLADSKLDPMRFAVVSDALEEAGCDCVPLLEHLRGRGPHVRGCWALDLVLGRE